MWVLDPSPFNFTSFMQLNFSPLPNLQNKILVPLHINPGSSAIQFHHVKNITSQHNSNYSTITYIISIKHTLDGLNNHPNCSTTHIIFIQSKLFSSYNYNINTSSSTKSN